MNPSAAEVVICGSGIAGVSTAYHLAVTYGVQDIVLIDERPPLSLTSDKSTECYRNWWPGPGNAMVSLMNRSIDILEELARESGNAFSLNRRGYLFATAEPSRIEAFKAQAEEAAELGAGPVRYHTGSRGEPSYQPAPASGYEKQPTGADLITDKSLIHKHFPYLSEQTEAVIHPRRCGWFSAQQLGTYFFERAQEHGVRLIEGKVEGVEVLSNSVKAVRVHGADGPRRIATANFVNAAGPFLKSVGEMIEVNIPVHSELHMKVAINDHLGVFPREAPLLIWTDPQILDWSSEERMLLEEDPDSQILLQEFPQGVHARPEGPADSPIVLMLWTYDTDPVPPTFPIKHDPLYPEIVLRGLTKMIPGLKAYFNRMPKPVVDGGYYTKTEENRPLVGPLPVEGSWVLGALSGYGLMAAPACGELLAAHITGADLPEYARWFALSRYDDPEYRLMLKDWGGSGQL